MPKVSIIIPAYNKASNLNVCLKSISRQSFADFEAIVIDDCSEDTSADIARSFADKDSRFSLIPLLQNSGPHLARAAGVEHARGEWLMFLDGDDELSPDALGKLTAYAYTHNTDIIHFGESALEGTQEDTHEDAREGAPQDAREEVREDMRGTDGGTKPYINRDTVQDADGSTRAKTLPKTLFDSAILEAGFKESEGYKLDWRITQRLYKTDLVKRAFSTMPCQRLDLAEDAFETFVVCALAHSHTNADDICVLQHRKDRNKADTSPLSLEGYDSYCRSYAACIRAARTWADKTENATIATCARGMIYQCGVLLANDWLSRLSSADKLAGAHCLVESLGAAPAIAQIWRFIRDRAYEHLARETPLAPEDEAYTWIELASVLEKEYGVKTGADAHLHRFKTAARTHLASLQECADLARFSGQPIRIFVSTHIFANMFDSDILQPIQVGSARASMRYSFYLHDDIGDNISELNSRYCELCAQYWAWKNVDADYIGFCHYRRYFDFSPTKHAESAWGEIMDEYIDAQSQKEYGLTDEEIRAAVEGWDVITTEIKDLRSFPISEVSVYEHYAAAPYLKIEDLERAIAILVQQHPDYAEDAKTYLTGTRTCFCNMFVMRRDIFREYAGWLFPILEEFCAQTDMSLYSKESLRTPGHLAERLLNIFLLHARRTGRDWKHKQVQCVHFTFPDRVLLPGVPEPPDPWRPTIPLVFAADNAYVPILACAMHSVLANASPAYFYDITVIHNDIVADNRATLENFVLKSDKASLRFVEVGALAEKYGLSTNNAHIGIQTYYRFLIPDLMPWYDKVLYLDSDLIVCADISALFAVDIGSNLLGAVHDIDFLGNLNLKDGARLAYNEEILHMHDPYRYFQAGVLILNTAEMRRAHSAEEWFALASEPRYIYNDQDALNVCCEERVQYLDWRWNVMHDCDKRVERIFTYAPAEAYESYLASRTKPFVVHYAGFEKPWKYPGCDMAELFWHYARQTPFYETLLAHIEHTVQIPPAKTMRDRLRERITRIIKDPDGLLHRITDPLFPYGSARREKLKRLLGLTPK